MKEHAVKCPNCGAALEDVDNLDTFFCKYCGYKIILDGQSDESYRAKVKIKAMEHAERMATKKFEQERYKIEQENNSKHKENKMSFIITAVIFTVLISFCVISFCSAERKSKKQEAELQQLVDEIMVDIDNGDFNTAYIKAQSIDYTADWSSDIDEKWDNTRREVINQIIEAEKEKTGKSTHKPEKKGFWKKLLD